MGRGSWLLLPCYQSFGLAAVGPHQPLLDQPHEAVIACPAEASGVAVERRLICNQRQLMPDEQAKHFSQRIDLALEPLSRPVLPVKPRPEALVQFLRAPALEPGIERVGKYLRLRRARAGGKRGQLRRQIIGKVELMRSEEHTSEIQSLMRISYAVFCL